ncbi:hypothetical protein JCM11251_001603 [Rhodosporidiobolus azoricus]
MVNMQLDSHATASAQSAGPALEDLFNDEAIAPLGTATVESMGDLSNPMVMRTYYSRLFPFKQLFLWLNQAHAPTKQWTHREFAFTLQNDAYLRYQSFNTAEDLRAEIIRLNPSRFEIGPEYSGRPNARKALMKSAFRPLTRELVFDIDMTDYDSVRTCCKDKAMCRRCWKFITVAVKVLDELLRQDFGFSHLLWVYSGRRGIHLWISDPSAMDLTDDQRSAIVRYIDMVKGYTTMDKRMGLIRPLHPTVERAFKQHLAPAFAGIVLADQECLKDEEQWSNVVKLIPDKEKANTLYKEIPPTSSLSSRKRWDAIRVVPSAPQSATAAVKEKIEQKHADAVNDIIIQYTYPRIDTEVSRKLNHLLKAPFCVHPGTGKVCVPLLASQIDSFDPDSVPTVGSLLMEIEALVRQGGGANKYADWSRTSLRPYVEILEKHAEGVARERVRLNKAAKAHSMEF